MADQQWYMALSGHQVGPVVEAEVVANVRNGSIDANTHLFASGMSDWTRLKDIPRFASALGRPGRAPVPTPPGRTAHEIDFEISGTEMQFVEVELDPGESAVAEAGSMMYMTQGIQMETVFGDASHKQQSGIMGALLGAGSDSSPAKAYFDRVHQPGAREAPCGVRRTVCGQDPRHGSGQARR